MQRIDDAMFRSFFMGGFECSTHRLRSGKRLDMVAATAHDRHVVADYERLARHGIRVAREGLRWHLIERRPGHYDFSGILPMIRAARDAGIQVIWDLFHYGWPEYLDIHGTEFIWRFAGLAGAFTKLLREETDEIPFITPINEISFLAWKAGEIGEFHPFSEGRGDTLKAQLVRSAIEGIEAIWSVEPRARIVHADPVFNVIPDPASPEEALPAETWRLAQYEAWDMLRGKRLAELGGEEKYLDIIGINYYPWNQWMYRKAEGEDPTVWHTDERYRPFRDILGEVHERYRRPMIVSETSSEGEGRAGWLRYVGAEVAAAIERGLPLEGICIYPIVSFPGWENERHCHNGMWDYASENGERELHHPLALELRRQRSLLEPVRTTD